MIVIIQASILHHWFVCLVATAAGSAAVTNKTAAYQALGYEKLFSHHQIRFQYIFWGGSHTGVWGIDLPKP